jgi:hypothetical protein
MPASATIIGGTIPSGEVGRRASRFIRRGSEHRARRSIDRRHRTRRTHDSADRHDRSEPRFSSDPLAHSIDGALAFDSGILAIVSSTALRVASDFSANTGVSDLNPPRRGLASGDSGTISRPRQIRFNTFAGTPGDYGRVLTSFSPGAIMPEPGPVPCSASPSAGSPSSASGGSDPCDPEVTPMARPAAARSLGEVSRDAARAGAWSVRRGSWPPVIVSV